jgi:hypothetical protein
LDLNLNDKEMEGMMVLAEFDGEARHKIPVRIEEGK